MTRLGDLNGGIPLMPTNADVNQRPARGGHWLQMESILESLYYQCFRHEHTWSADPSTPTIAPECSLTDFNTWTSFASVDGTHDNTFEFPWRMQTGFDAISVDLFVMIPSTNVGAFFGRVQTGTLVTSVDTVTSGATGFSLIAPRDSLPAGWKQDPLQYNLAVGTVKLVPDVDTDRLVVVRPQAMLAPAGSPIETTTYGVKLFAIAIRDDLEEA